MNKTFVWNNFRFYLFSPLLAAFISVFFAIHLFLHYLLGRLVRHSDRQWEIVVLTFEWCFIVY